MAITIGRVRECPVMHAKFVALGHNTIRGAAGAAILNAELMHAEGMLHGGASVPRASVPVRIETMKVMKFGGTSVADQARSSG